MRSLLATFLPVFPQWRSGGRLFPRCRTNSASATSLVGNSVSAGGSSVAAEIDADQRPTRTGASQAKIGPFALQMPPLKHGSSG